MKKKNGFIATSTIYSFLIVFVALTLSIIGTYTHYQILLKQLNAGVIEELNNKISSSYAYLTNTIKNGSINDQSAWRLSNFSYDGSTSATGPLSIKFTPTASNASLNSNITQFKEDGLAATKRYFYIRFRSFRNGNFNDASMQGSVGVNIYKSGNNSSSNINVTYNCSETNLKGGFNNWLVQSCVAVVPKSQILNQYYGASFQIKNHPTTSKTTIYLDDIMLIDVTKLIINNGWSSASVRQKLDKVDYFDDSYSLIIG